MVGGLDSPLEVEEEDGSTEFELSDFASSTKSTKVSATSAAPLATPFATASGSSKTANPPFASAKRRTAPPASFATSQATSKTTTDSVG